MTAVLSDAYTLAEQPVFQQRVMMSLIYAAENVMSEDPTALHHAERVAYANVVLHAPEVEGMNMALGVAIQPGITMDPSDSDIQFTVNALFDAYAGVDSQGSPP